MEPILKLEHIQKYYGNGGNVTKAIQDISFSVSEGEFLGIMGASGSGKTTLLNCISTIDTVSAGDILLDGESIAALPPRELARFRRERLGFVFQDFLLLDGLTVRENILLPAIIGGAVTGQTEARADQLCDVFGISAIRDKYPAEISGGEKQRISIARALLKDAPIVLLDEATASLDPENEVLIQQAISALVAEKTVIVIAHRLQSIMSADNILVLEDGRVAESGTHEQLLAAGRIYANLWAEQSRAGIWRL